MKYTVKVEAVCDNLRMAPENRHVYEFLCDKTCGGTEPFIPNKEHFDEKNCLSVYGQEATVLIKKLYDDEGFRSETLNYFETIIKPRMKSITGPVEYVKVVFNNAQNEMKAREGKMR